MILYMVLIDMDSNQIIYKFGFYKENLDGLFKINLIDLMESKIIQSSSYVSDRMAMKGLIKLIRNIRNNEIKKFECFQS